MTLRIPRALRESLIFIIFVVAYYAPIILDFCGLPTLDVRARALIRDSLLIPNIQIDILRNALGHVVPLLAYYTLLVFLARRFGSAACISPAISNILFITTGLALILAINGILFPLSDYAFFYAALAHPVILLSSSLFLVAATAFSILRSPSHVRLLTASVAILVVAGTVGATATSVQNRATEASSRNIIIIGVDSLSRDTFEANRHHLPNLSKLAAQGTSFNRAYTPIGRTFPAWMSILSGMSPAEHRAVFNLRNLEQVRKDGLFTHSLKAIGYQTIFAIDERRFAHIDESFGFDRVIGPKAGLLDFVLQRVNDTPLTNLLLQTRLAAWILPFSYSNTASHVNYDSNGFIERTVEAVKNNAPLFLAVHFESAHFPFKSGHTVKRVEYPNRFLARHVSALTGVDAQVGKLIATLADRGYLNDALVLLLSDHGEGFGEVEAETTRGGVPFTLAAYGHGASAISEKQNAVIFSVLRYSDGRPSLEATRSNKLVSLTDVKGIVEQFAYRGDPTLNAAHDCVFSETGIRFLAAKNYETLNAAQLVSEAAQHYEIDQDGRMRLRESSLPRLVADKDVAFRCEDRLTYFSSLDGRYFSYAFGEKKQLLEVKPRENDVLQIQKYRNALSVAARPFHP